MRWPTIPKKIQGAGGPIRVRMLKRVTGDKKEPCWGVWEAGIRTVSLERGARLEHKWRVLFHELTHAALDDAGITHMLSVEGNEAVCDAMATARVRQMRGELGLDR